MYFDLGNVLVFFCYKKMIQQISHVTALSSQQVQKLLIDDKMQEEYETGKINAETLFTQFARRSPRSFSILEFMNAASDIFTPNEPIFPIVRDLKKQNIRLILLSNTNECHFNRIYSHYPILREFDDLILSYEAKACKPNPLIFHKALAAAGCPKSECFYIDDIHEYVASARKLGLDSEVYSSTDELKKHLLARKVQLSST